jgi:hypothetical protein
MANQQQQLTAPDVDAGFQNDWNLANQRYLAGVDSGYSPEEADTLFLSPVRTKWDILKNVPSALQSKAANELGNAQVSYIQNVNAGYSPQDASNRVLAPIEEKWQASSGLRERALPDPLLEEKVGALQEASTGYDPMQILQSHPRSIFADPEFTTRFEAAAQRGQKSREQEQARADAATKKAALADDPDTIIKQVNELNNITSGPRFQALPPDSQQDIAGEQTRAEAKLAQAIRSKSTDGLPDSPSTGPEKFATKYRSADEVKDAYRSKELSKDEATKILQGQFGMQ